MAITVLKISLALVAVLASNYVSATDGHKKVTNHGWGHQEVKSHGWGHQEVKSHGWGHEEVKAHGWGDDKNQGWGSYKYGYAVNDHHKGDVKSAQESSHEGWTKGSYSLLQPDGKTRTVHYEADPKNGFRAKVEYSGWAKPEAHGWAKPENHGWEHAKSH